MRVCGRRRSREELLLLFLLEEPEGDVLPWDVPGDGAAEGPLWAAAQAQEPRHRRLQDRTGSCARTFLALLILELYRLGS